jgi:hypothetical protein
MLKYDVLTRDQVGGVDRLYECDHTLMVGKMGSGKTIVALTAMAELLAGGVVNKILVVAPLKVCKTVWAQEAANWEHTKHLKIGLCVGGQDARLNVLKSDVDIVVINFENLPWLFRAAGGKGYKKFFDGLVIDELSKLKSVGGSQFKALRFRLDDFSWRVGLTGTPVSEDWAGLFGQMMIIDRGASLGTRKDMFMKKYFYPTDYMQYNWELNECGAEEIAAAIKPYVYTLPDYRSELPPIYYMTLKVRMPPPVRERYDELKNTMISGEVEAVNAAVLSGKLQQAASGFLYIDKMPAGRISDFRIRAAIEECKRRGPTLLCYWFKEDYYRLLEVLAETNLGVGDLSAKGFEETVDQWNAGILDVLLCHPRSAGHGLNLAKGGSRVVWLAPQWSRDLWEQTNARLWRRGQKKEVTVTTIMSDADIDEMVALRVNNKAEFDRQFGQYFS